MNRPNGLRFEGTRFWVTHRYREFGPFDYEWSKDFQGIELLYRGEKFGEYCSADEIFADLRPFKLPKRVVEVTCVVFGSTLYGLLNGLPERDKRADLIQRLQTHGCGKFTRQIIRDVV